LRVRSGPDATDVARVAEALVRAKRPVLYAGQGVHYAASWDDLRELAELLEAPVTTSLQGKSAFPENHPLSLGSGGRSMPKPVRVFLDQADLIFGIGCSFTKTGYGVSMPSGPKMIQSTLDSADLAKDLPVDDALLGDAKLTLRALIAEVSDRLGGKSRGRAGTVAAEIASVRAEWLAQWTPKLESDETPLSPYRCRQSTRSTLPVLGGAHAAELSRLGEDDATRVRVGIGNGRETRPAGPALYQRLGRRGHRLHRNGLRNGRA
jgi:acetolactate synthase-1/2/3 large subunit